MNLGVVWVGITKLSNLQFQHAQKTSGAAWLHMYISNSISVVSFPGNPETQKFKFFLFCTNHGYALRNPKTSKQSPGSNFKKVATICSI